MNTPVQQPDGPEGRTRWTRSIVILLLSSMFLGVGASDDPTSPVPFQGVLSIFDGTSPPENNNSVGLSAYSLSHGTHPHVKVLNPPVELDKQFQGLLCWDVYCSDFNDPPPWDAVEFGGSLTSYGTYFCEGPVLCSTSFMFYFQNSDIVACPNSGCVKDVDVRFFSRFGSVEGRVTLRDGTPAIAKTVVAIDPEGKLKSVNTDTDAYGFYDFSAAFAPVEPDHPAYGKVYPPVPIDPDNHWGLTVYGDGGLSDRPKEYYSGSQGQKEWLVGPAGRPKVTVNVRGGEAALASFVIPLPGEEEDDPDKQDCFTEGEPVSIMTGNVFFHQTDAVMNDLRGPFAFVRTYNSQNAYYWTEWGLFGPGWSHSYGSRLSFPTSYRGLILRASNGVPVYYTDPDDDGSYHAYLPLTEQSWVVRSGDVYTRFLLDGSREVYDAEGRLIEQVDPFGGVTQLEYDGWQLARVRAPGGRAFSFTRASDALYLSAPEGVVAVYGFNVSGRLDRVDYPDGSGFRFFYDDLGQLTVMLDATGRVIERHTYVEGKAVTSERGEGQERFTFQYEPGRTTVTDPLGNESIYEFSQIHEDSVLTKVTGRCSVCGGTGRVREWTYDDLARVVTFTDGPGHVWRYTYDAQGNVLTETNPDNKTTVFTYDTQGRVLSRLDPDEALTTFTYGPFGILTRTDPMLRTTTVEYDARGLRSSVRNARGGLFQFTYNELGDLTRVTDPIGRSVQYEVDAMGRRVRVSDAMGNSTRFSYDARGRLRKVTRADGGFLQISYDGAGRRASVSDAMGASTSYIYDATGRLERIVDPLNQVTTLGYDSMSNVTSLTDPRGNVTRFQYDEFRRVTQITYPDNVWETFLYDEWGRLASHTDRKGTVITFFSDAMGRLTGKTYSDGTPSVGYEYDAMGRLLKAENDADTLTLDYDIAGQLLSETSATNQSSVAYEYDPLGNRLSLSLDGEIFASYDHDAASRLRSLTHGSNVFRFEDDDGYRRTQLILPNAVTTTYGYDPASRPAHISAVSGAAPVSVVDYAYDMAGRVTAASTGELIDHYSYDALSRLTSVDRTGGELGHWAYAFDASGNRTNAMNDRNVTTATYDGRNQLLRLDPGGTLWIRGELDEPGTVEVNGEPAALLPGHRFEATVNVPMGTSTVEIVATDGSGNVRTNTYEVDVDGTSADFQYDANGNLIVKTEGPTTWSYEWNGEDQLTRVLRDGVEIARFAYDPLGRRVQKTTAVATTTYAYDETRILQEKSLSGDTVRYVHGPQVDEPLAVDKSGVLTFYHLDALGSVVATTDAGGEQTASRRYDAFGNPEGSIPSGYAYTGREWDAETGLYYYRARYYDPQIGRFISEDPIRFGGGLNLYAYVAGSPVNLRDPSGTSWLRNTVDSLLNAWDNFKGNSTYTEIADKKWYEIGKDVAEWVAGGLHGYEAIECLKEQLDCEKKEGRYCRCSKNLGAAGRADCELKVTEKCTADSLPCYEKVLMETVLSETVFRLLPGK